MSAARSRYRRDYSSLAAFLPAHDYDGIRWHHPDGRMAKLKRRDLPNPLARDDIVVNLGRIVFTGLDSRRAHTAPAHRADAGACGCREPRHLMLMCASVTQEEALRL